MGCVRAGTSASRLDRRPDEEPGGQRQAIDHLVGYASSQRAFQLGGAKVTTLAASQSAPKTRPRPPLPEEGSMPRRSRRWVCCKPRVPAAIDRAGRLTVAALPDKGPLLLSSNIKLRQCPPVTVFRFLRLVGLALQRFDPPLP